MFALILESLGSTELIFILAIALIFFGPRKLPQLARTMGKGLAEFRKASDDFKRTWEREVAMETATVNSLIDETVSYEGPKAEDDEGPQTEDQSTEETPAPELVAADPELVVPRESPVQTTSEATPEVEAIPAEAVQPEPVRKQEWL